MSNRAHHRPRRHRGPTTFQWAYLTALDDVFPIMEHLADSGFAPGPFVDTVADDDHQPGISLFDDGNSASQREFIAVIRAFHTRVWRHLEEHHGGMAARLTVVGVVVGPEEGGETVEGIVESHGGLLVAGGNTGKPWRA